MSAVKPAAPGTPVPRAARPSSRGPREDQGKVDGATGQPQEVAEVKDSFGDDRAYRRLKLIGQGSFGKAYLARDLASDELCVMKQIRMSAMDAKARDTAVREAIALRKVIHPNVVRFRQVFMRSGWLCLVMEFADGGDLCTAVKERAKQGAAFEEGSVLECFAQVADAVRHVHALRMIHRDIKSRNIFLCRSGKALLGDFGLVRVLESTCALAQTRVGTPYYLSPEIVRKQPYSYLTDVWSLGVLLYEMTALTRPFQGTLQTLPEIICKGEYAPIAANYSDGLRDLIAGMLAVDPKRRIDLAESLCGGLLAEPLARAKEALGLEAPGEIAKRKPRIPADPSRKKELVNLAAPEKQDEFMGFNTMIRRKGDGPLVHVTPTGEVVAACAAVAGGQSPEAAAPCARGGLGTITFLGTITGRPEDWSRNADKDDSDDEGSVSNDSWGSVVEDVVSLEKDAGT